MKGVNYMSNTALTEAVYYILLSLMQPMYGYGIMQNIDQLSNGRLKLAAGTLYGKINTLLDKGRKSLCLEKKTAERKNIRLRNKESKHLKQKSFACVNLLKTEVVYWR